MKAVGLFLCSPEGGKRYNNTKDIGGLELVTNVSEEDHKASNRYAVVIETPAGYRGPVEKGDTLLVHHNVFKFYNDTHGRRKNSMSFFKDDQFLINEEQFYMYKRDGVWTPIDRYCFVKPVESMGDRIATKYEPLVGTMAYPNEYLKSKGITEGTLVSFAPESEYEFDIDGELMYRVFDHQITMELCPE